MRYRKNSRVFISILLATILLFGTIIPVGAVQKVSNPNDFGLIDGIDTDKETGWHNSYAWCSELFKQADADYLWVGMNRDFGNSLFSVSTNPFAKRAVTWADFPEESEDQAGKIYRQKQDGNVNEWELVYENPAINGYRRMILFKGDLYVLAGITNKPEYDYSIILRFKPNFKLGDTPEIVLWEQIPDYVPVVGVEDIGGTVPEYYRSACVFEGKLYIGTTDSKIYATDGTRLASLTPENGPKSTGWDLVFDFEESSWYEESPVGSSYGGASYIWDLIGFNGSIYAFATNAGFTVYKFTPNNGSFDVEQIVGSKEGAKYPRGMGIDKNVMASPFLITSFEEDYIYVSTFASGPLILGQMFMGQPKDAIDGLFAPAQVYRFDKNDNWEVVVGDKTGKFVAKDTEGSPLPVIGNQRAGFFLGDENQENISLNQYTWWMCEYEGKLYVTTWDIGILKGDFDFLFISLFINEMGDDGAGVASELLASFEQFQDAMDNFKAASGFAKLSEGGKVILSVFKLIFTVLSHLPDYIKSLSAILPIVMEYKDYISDESNPAGFDLYVSDNGKDFTPVSVDGFGYADNYGGRVLLPTEYGLFCTTANPYGGGQVWRIDNLEEEIKVNLPAAISLNSEPLKFDFSLLIKKNAAIAPTVASSSDQVTAELVAKNTKLITDTIIQNDIVSSKGPVSKAYKVSKENIEFNLCGYELVLCAEDGFSGDVTLTFNAGNLIKTVAITVN